MVLSLLTQELSRFTGIRVVDMAPMAEAWKKVDEKGVLS
jgi:hypothetical protein